MATGNACNLYPQVGNEDSELYTGLLRLKVPRLITNLIYACYLQQGVAALLDAAGYERNKQGQHTAKDVYNYFDVVSIINESNEITKAKIDLGAIDPNGNNLYITDLVEATKKVIDFNKTHKGLVASVFYNGSNFYYYVGQRDSRTINLVNDMNKNAKVWSALNKQYKAANIDIDQIALQDFVNSFFNPAIALDSYNNLMGLKNVDSKYLGVSNIELLLMLNPEDFGVRSLYNIYGDNVITTATMIKDVLSGVASVTPARESLIIKTINRIKQLPNINSAELMQDINNGIDEVKNSTEGKIEATLKQLETQFNMNISEILLNNKSIKTLEEAEGAALLTLNRRLKELNDIADKNPEQINERDLLKQDIRELQKAIEHKQYYVGALKFLTSADEKMIDVKQLIADFKQDLGDKKTTAFNRARIIQEIKNIVDGYITVTSTFRNIENLDSAVALTSAEIDNIKNTADNILETFRPLLKTITLYRESVMNDLVTSILGDTMPDGTPVSEALKGMDLEKHWGDNFYSFARSTNPLIGAMGTITRDAQLDRDQEYNKIVNEIKQIHSKLGFGKSTKFMYEKDNMHLISDIDWDAYYNARKTYKESLKTNGLKDSEIKQKMYQWWDSNTEDRIVDVTNGRTERVPDSQYRKPMPDMTDEQKEYYKSMMALKGRLESLMDKRGRSLYRPPQVKRDSRDVLFNSRNAADIIKGIGIHTADSFRMTENDEDNAAFNTTINGEEYSESRGDYNGEIKKRIPIFFVNRLNNASELMLDFSSAIQAEACAATNFAAMSETLDVVEFMQDYINYEVDYIPENNGITKGESKQSEELIVLQKLRKAASESGCGELMQSYIDMQYYGIKLKDTTKFRTVAKKLISYTSLKALALNIKGAFNNYLVGEYQMIIEAGGAEFYNFKDYATAHVLLFGDLLSKTPGKIYDLVNHTKGSYDVLLAEKFGMYQKGIQEQARKRYYANPLMQILSEFEPLIGYAIGENFIHYVSGMSRLNHVKVLLNGKKIPLRKAYEKTGDSDNPTLKLKDGVTDLYGNPITEEFEKAEKNIILYLAQSSHGAMTDEDKGVITQRLIGRFMMNFRQWMVETYARRERDTHWDGVLHQNRTGYQREARRIIKGTFQHMVGMNMSKNAIAWQNATDAQKANFRRAITSWGLIICMLGLKFFAFDEDDEDDEDTAKMKKKGLYYVNRGLNELVTTDIPVVGIAMTTNTLLKSPAAAQKTISNATYPIIGLINGDLEKTRDWHDEEVNTYLYKTGKYFVPFFKDIDKLYTEYIEGEDSGDDKTFDINQWYR